MDATPGRDGEGDDESHEPAGDLYTDFDISEHLENARDVSGLRNTDPDATEYSEFQETLNEVEDLLAERYETLAEYIATKTIDVVDEDDCIDSGYHPWAMARAYILKLLSPDISSFDMLNHRLERSPEIAEKMYFDADDIPSRTTFSTQWWERYRPDFREHLRYEAARAAVQAQKFDLEISERGEELIEEFDRSTDEQSENIPERRQIEHARRDQVFNEFSHLFHNVLDYDRGPNASVPTETLTELATFVSRRNETVLGGRDVYVKETDDVTDSEYICEETLSSPIRALSRKLATDRYSEFEAVPPGEQRHKWELDPEDRDFGEGDTWHKRTERGIEQQIEMLQSRGMLDRPVDICIDGTARDYHKRADTNVAEPPGVNRRYDKFETGYAYEDITVTAIYRGRAIVLASFSYAPDNSHFQAVRYCIDRARDLVQLPKLALFEFKVAFFGLECLCNPLHISHSDATVRIFSVS